MTKNMGLTDRVIRALIGIAAISAGVAYSSWWGVLGIIPLATALISWCPAYVPFGIRTCRVSPEASKS